jgi:GWxTD domain-containing protein
MMMVAQLYGHPLFHALGWSLLHFCWQGTLVAMLLAIALGILRGRSPRIRYAACCFALGLMAALPVITFARLASNSGVIEKAEMVSQDHETTFPTQTTGFTHAEPWLRRISTAIDSSLPIVTLVWILGVILLLGWLNVGIVITGRMKSFAAQPAPHELQLVLKDLIRRLKVTQAVRLVHSAMVQVPTVIGWLRPVILIPAGCMAGLSAAQVGALIAHELAHVRRHDYLVNLFQSLVEALLFYHPCVWWVSKQIRNEREHCCDDLAVAVCGDPLSYAKALSFVEERRFSISAVAVGLDGGVLTMRIRRLLGSKEGPAVSRVAALTMLTFALVTTGFCIAVVAHAQAVDADKQVAKNGASASELSGPYRQWLDEDVRWIISPEERAAYMRLPDNAERLEFIKQFWDRRNPKPGSAENTIKEEHYRRIAYANVHFAAGKAGWMTDRGRIYIVNGRPDSIDSHPTGGLGETKPYEVWEYGQTQMKFVDRCACGDYELEAPTK